MNLPPNRSLADYIRSIPDFPKPGILFRDITPLLANPGAFHEAIIQMADPYRDQKIDLIASAEARGFIFAGPLAIELGVGHTLIRKPGKLPGKTLSISYELEYGTDTLEIDADATHTGQRILVVDDLLATGGTVEACCKLVERTGAEVIGTAFVIELVGLGGAQRLAKYNPKSLIQYQEC